VFKVTGWGIMLICGMTDTSVCWYFKTRLESGPVTADLTTTVVHSYKLPMNDITHVRSLTLYLCTREEKCLRIISS